MALDQDALNSLRLERGPQQYQSSTARPWWRRPWVWLVALVVIAAAFALRRPTPVVSVATVTAAQVQGASAVLDASGYVVARRQATVSAKVTGKVLEVHVEEGMKVKQGQVLAVLDTSTTQRQLDLAQEQLRATQASIAQLEVRLTEAKRTARRAEQLRSSKLISEADFDAAQASVADLAAQLAALQSQVRVSEASVRVQQQAISDLTVRAPFAGVVISKDAQPGEMISPISAGGGFTRTGIATIVDMDSREIEVDVNESFINRVSDNQPAEAVLDAYPDWTIPAHVISIVPTADRQKATVKVRIGFDQLDARILPDMGVKVRFLDTTPVTAARTVLSAPSAVLTNVDGKPFVWRVVEQRLESVSVATGPINNDRVELQSGVNAGDVLVLNPADTFKAKMKVRVQDAAAGQ